MTVTKTLAYSPMTDKVYWIDGKGQKHDLTDQYRYVMIEQVKNFDNGWKEIILNKETGEKFILKVQLIKCIDEYPLPQRDDETEYYADIHNLDKDMEDAGWCDHCKEEFTLGYYGRT